MHEDWEDNIGSLVAPGVMLSLFCVWDWRFLLLDRSCSGFSMLYVDVRLQESLALHIKLDNYVVAEVRVCILPLYWAKFIQ